MVTIPWDTAATHTHVLSYTKSTVTHEDIPCAIIVTRKKVVGIRPECDKSTVTTHGCASTAPVSFTSIAANGHMLGVSCYAIVDKDGLVGNLIHA